METDRFPVLLQIPDPEWFSSRHKTPSGCTLRLLHYPALPADTDYQPEVDIRAGAHSDYGE
jgi:isopenicillin N synthase-like dioxygenase